MQKQYLHNNGKFSIWPAPSLKVGCLSQRWGVVEIMTTFKLLSGIIPGPRLPSLNLLSPVQSLLKDGREDESMGISVKLKLSSRQDLV